MASYIVAVVGTIYTNLVKTPNDYLTLVLWLHSVIFHSNYSWQLIRTLSSEVGEDNIKDLVVLSDPTFRVNMQKWP